MSATMVHVVRPREDTIIDPLAKIPRLTLDDEVTRALGRELQKLGSPYKNPHGMRLEAFQAVIAHLPRGVLQHLMRMRCEPEMPGALVIKNLPIDILLPRTPADGGVSREKRTFVSEGIQLGVASFLGHPFSFLSEKDGVIVHNICPLPGREDTPANDSSRSDFKAHIECAFSLSRPDFLLLLCLRPDPEHQAGTLVVDIRKALRYLSPFDHGMLREPLFQIQAPLSFAKGLGGQPWSAPQPVLTGPEASPEVCLNLNGMRAVTPGAQKSLDLLREVLESPEVIESVILDAGDLLVVDNRKAVHGRTPFKARYDGFDRWLQRVYVKVDVWPARDDRDGAIVF